MNTRFFKLHQIIVTAIFLQFYATVAIAADIRNSKVDWAALNPEIAGATYVNGSDDCLECHEDYMQGFAVNRHGINLLQDCESCHGPMSKHMDAPRRKPALVVSLKKGAGLDPEQRSSVCLQCHEGSAKKSGTPRMYWHMSQHAAAENACTTCHDVEAPTDKVLDRSTQAKVCFACHHEQRAQMLRRSRHPIKEGKVVCSSCHNPHGSPGPAQLVKNTVNETCYQCHQEKRGPLLWEHQPVREDCGLCHDPHGSTQPRMLTVRQPWLCQECHEQRFHPSDLRDGAEIAGFDDRVVAKSCTNCHSRIHGSNHPSGARLTR